MKINKQLLLRSMTALSLASIGTLFNPAYGQDYQPITRFGTNQAVCPGGVDNIDQLRRFFNNNPNALGEILADASWNGSEETILDAINSGSLAIGQYPKGTKLEWSSAKVDSNFVAKPYRVWAGSDSFSAFSMTVDDNCVRHEFVIPLACCNLSLIQSTPISSETCRDADAIDNSNVAARSTSDNQIEYEAVADTESTPTKPLEFFVGAFAGSETRPRFEESWQMDMVDSSGIYGLRAGMFKPLSNDVRLFGQASVYERNGVNVGNTYPDSNAAIDFGAEKRFANSMFVNGGVGLWNVDDSEFRDASLFGTVGGKLGSQNLNWFVEGRIFDSDSDTNSSISDNRMFSVGLRYLIQ